MMRVGAHVHRQWPVVGQDRLAARPVSMIRRVVGLGAAGRIAQVMGQLATPRALDNGFLEAANGRLELLGRQRPLADKLIENLVGNRRQRGVRQQGLAASGHSRCSWYAPHTKFLTPSFVLKYNRTSVRSLFTLLLRLLSFPP
jgi:hypothetical protein